ncbi:MAG: AmmeMemoRadiSam system protein B [Sphingomonadales bacterium]
MPKVRRAAVAGVFYAADPRMLASDVGRMLDAAEAPDRPPPKAIIAPHAGYRYSGPVAAKAFAMLAKAAGRTSRVVILGPAHYEGSQGIFIPRQTVFDMPLGAMQVDREAVAAIESLPRIVFSDEAHRPEHSVEVQLPFLRVVLDEIMVVPLLVSRSSAEQVAEVLRRLWDGDDTVIVISSDLSHYEDYDSARMIDATTAAAIEALDGTPLNAERACGYRAIQGLLLEARRRGLTIERLDLGNSGDTAGDKSSVVGYGAWALWE